MILKRINYLLFALLSFYNTGCQTQEEQLTPSNFINSKYLSELNSELALDGHELANHFLEILVQNGPIDIEKFDSTANDVYKKELPRIENAMNGKISLLDGYGIQEIGNPVDWFHAPKGDLQWPTHLARHYWLKPLAHAWRATKDPKYSERIVSVLLDWIEKNPIGSKELKWEGRSSDFKNLKEGYFKSYVDGPWTSLSAHARIDIWSYLLIMIHDSPQMNNKNLSIIFNSLAKDHLNMMMAYPRKMNQYIAIASSLIKLSWYYPFLQNVEEAAGEGYKRAQYFADTEIYPDGSMAECSPNYSKFSLQRIYEIAEEDKKRGGELYETLAPNICNAIRYFFFSSDPNGNSPRIAKGESSVYSLLEKINIDCKDPEILYLYTDGREGEEPNFFSVSYNWAGHVIFRSDWGKEASWLFFEPGPRGSGHSDAATLNMQLQSKGEWILTDPGFYTYSNSGKDGQIAKYLNSSEAHNVASIDNKNQLRFEKGKSRAFNTKPGNYGWNYDGTIAQAEGTYTYGFGDEGEIKVVHKREVTYIINDNKFKVKDVFSGEEDHDVTLYWQLHPKAEFLKTGGGFQVQNGKAQANFNISCNNSFTVNTSKGRKEPLAGWYSESYGELEPATRVEVRTHGKLPVVFTTEIRLKD